MDAAPPLQCVGRVVEADGDYQASVMVVVERTELGATFPLEIECCDSVWKLPAMFGVRYAVTLISDDAVIGRGLKVKILWISGSHPETTDIVVAFAAAKSVLDALGFVPKDAPRYDAANRGFVFPAGRFFPWLGASEQRRRRHLKDASGES